MIGDADQRWLAIVQSSQALEVLRKGVHRCGALLLTQPG